MLMPVVRTVNKCDVSIGITSGRTSDDSGIIDCMSANRLMKVLMIHNRYRTSAPSGEDVAVANERHMLQAHGVDVFDFDRCNDNIDDSTLIARATAAANTIWSRGARSDLLEMLRHIRPDVVHVHNTFAVLSPSIYGVCKAANLPVVQTLHNFRLFCPGALFLRDGKPCEDCLDRSLLQSVRHRCYRGSFAATATLASMLTLHRALGTYSHKIDRYIALTQFARSKMLKAGIAGEKIAVKPNFVPDPPKVGEGAGDYVIYVGRLLEGKGTETLMAAWRRLPSVRLKIVGDGALRPRLEALARNQHLNIEFVGMQNRAALLKAISDAKLLVFPSEWYEGFPMVIAESYACGTPIVASRLGSMEELVAEGVTGAKFPAGDDESLARAISGMLADVESLRFMRGNARKYFDAHLTQDRNFAQLMSIYNETIADVAAGSAA